MDNNKIKKKVRSQKNAAIFLIIGPILSILSFFTKNDFEVKGSNGYMMMGSLIILIIIGLKGLRNSLRKEKELYK